MTAGELRGSSLHLISGQTLARVLGEPEDLLGG